MTINVVFFRKRTHRETIKKREQGIRCQKKQNRSNSTKSEAIYSVLTLLEHFSYHGN